MNTQKMSNTHSGCCTFYIISFKHYQFLAPSIQYITQSLYAEFHSIYKIILLF